MQVQQVAGPNNIAFNINSSKGQRVKKDKQGKKQSVNTS